MLAVNDAADRLGVHPSRVRALIAHGELAARKLGRNWIVDEGSVDERLDRPVEGGRPLSTANAWVLLWLTSGVEPGRVLGYGDLSQSGRRRVRARVAAKSPSELLRDLGPRLRRRGTLRRFRAHPADVPRLLAEPTIVRTGVSAAADYGADIVAPGVAEAYLPLRSLADLRRTYLLEPASNPNVLLRTVERIWPFPSACMVAPMSAVALDLLDSDDERTRRAGRELLARIGMPAQ